MTIDDRHRAEHARFLAAFARAGNALEPIRWYQQLDPHSRVHVRETLAMSILEPHRRDSLFTQRALDLAKPHTREKAEMWIARLRAVHL